MPYWVGDVFRQHQEQGADFLLTVKANQKTLHRQILTQKSNMSNSKTKTLNAALILCGSNELGGAERRFAILFQCLCANSPSSRIFVRKSLFNALMQEKLIWNKSYFSLTDDLLFASRFSRYFPSSINRVFEVIALAFYCRRFDNCHWSFNPSLALLAFILLMPLNSRLSFSIVDSGFSKYTKLYKFITILSLMRVNRVDCLSSEIASSAKTIARILERIGIDICTKIEYSTTSFPAVFYSSNHLSIAQSVIPFSTDTPRYRDIDLVFAARYSSEKGFNLLNSALLILESEYAITPQIIIHTTKEIDLKYPAIATKALIIANKSPISTMKRSKIFLSLQKFDNFPSQSVIEAMYCGCDIIATNCGLSHLFKNACPSMILIDNNPHSLAKSIVAKLQDYSHNNAPVNHRFIERRARSLYSLGSFRKYFLDRIILPA